MDTPSPLTDTQPNYIYTSEPNLATNPPTPDVGQSVNLRQVNVNDLTPFQNTQLAKLLGIKPVATPDTPFQAIRRQVTSTSSLIASLNNGAASALTGRFTGTKPGTTLPKLDIQTPSVGGTPLPKPGKTMVQTPSALTRPRVSAKAPKKKKR